MNGHAVTFEVEFVIKTSRATEASRERSTEQFFNDFLKFTGLLVKDSVLETSEDCFEPKR